MESLLALIDSSIDSPDTARVLSAYLLDRESDGPVEGGAMSAWLTSERDGLAIYLINDTIKQIQLYGLPEDGFMQFSGKLAFGLTYFSHRRDVEAVLGHPASSTPPSRLYLGTAGAVCRFDFPNYSVKFCFDASTGSICMICLMAP